MTVLLIGLIISLCRRTHEIASCGTFHVDFNAYVGAVYVLSGNVLYSSVYWFWISRRGGNQLEVQNYINSSKALCSCSWGLNCLFHYGRCTYVREHTSSRTNKYRSWGMRSTLGIHRGSYLDELIFVVASTLNPSKQDSHKPYLYKMILPATYLFRTMFTTLCVHIYVGVYFHFFEYMYVVATTDTLTIIS